MREGWLQLNMNNYLTRTVTFDAGMEAIACSIGSVIRVKHVGIEAEYSGRVVDYKPTGQRIITDQPMDLSNGPYQVSLYKPVETCRDNLLVTGGVGRADGTTMVYVLGTSVTDKMGVGTSTVGDANLMRLKLSSGAFASAPVLSIENNLSGNGVIVLLDTRMHPLATTVGTGSHVNNALFQTDVIRDFHILWDADAPETLDLVISESELGQLPDFSVPEDVHWIVSKVIGAKRMYRVVAIEGSADETTRKITALEYDDRIYSTTGLLPPPIIGGGDLPAEQISQVENLQGAETLIAKANTGTFTLNLLWETPAMGLYEGATIYKAPQGSDEWETVGSVHGGQLNGSLTHPNVGDVFYVKVQALDKAGKGSVFSSAPTLVWTVGTGVTILPIAITNFKASPGAKANTLQWTATDEFRVERYELKVQSALDDEALGPVDHTLAAPLYQLPGNVNNYHHQNIAVGSYRYYVRGVPVGAPTVYDPLVGWFPSNISRPLNSVTELLDYLNDRIGDTHLSDLLNERIDIGADIAERMNEIEALLEQVDLLDQIPDIFEQIGNLVDMETFIRVTSHLTRLGSVLQNTNVRILQTQNQLTTSTESAVSMQTVLAARLGNAEAGIIQEMEVRAQQDLAEATSRQTLAARVTGVETSTATIEDDLNVVATDLSAEATARRQLSVFITGTEDGTEILAGSVIYSEQQARATADTANASSIDTLQARLLVGGDIGARLATVETASTSNTAANATTNGLIAAEAVRITALETSINNPAGVLYTRLTNIETSNSTQTTDIAGHTTELNTQGGRITAVESAINTAGTGLLARIASAEATNVTQATNIATGVTNLSSVAGRVTTIETAINTPTTGVTARLATVETTNTTQATDIAGHTTSISGHATRLTTVETAINTPTTGISARILELQGTTVSLGEDIEAQVYQLTALEASVFDPMTANGVLAQLVNHDEILVTPTTGVVSRLNAAEITIGSHTTSLAETLEISDYEATYAVRVDANGYLSGFGLGVVNDPNGTPTSEFWINAESFAVKHPGSSEFALLIQGGNVYMPGTLITPGGVGSGQIGNGAVSDVITGTTVAGPFILDEASKCVVFYKAAGNVYATSAVSTGGAGQISAYAELGGSADNQIGQTGRMTISAGEGNEFMRVEGSAVLNLGPGEHTISLSSFAVWQGAGSADMDFPASAASIIVMVIKK